MEDVVVVNLLSYWSPPFLSNKQIIFQRKRAISLRFSLKYKNRKWQKKEEINVERWGTTSAKDGYGGGNQGEIGMVVG